MADYVNSTSLIINFAFDLIYHMKHLLNILDVILEWEHTVYRFTCFKSKIEVDLK